MAVSKYYEEDGITLYCGDCISAMPDLLDKSFDLCLTDFPYANNTDYTDYEDSRNNLSRLVNFGIPQMLRVSNRVLLTCGVGNIWCFPRPDWVLLWIVTAGVGSTKWGFSCWQPILAYGNDPYLKAGLGRRPDVIISNEISEKNGHPCPKPLQIWKSILSRGSVDINGVILDPFCGSGTTLIAAKQLGRKAVGIEISEKYCEIAVKRLAQMELFK